MRIKFIKFYLFIFICVQSNLIAQQSYTWNGGTGDWHIASNWSPSGVPGVNDTILVINNQRVNVDSAVSVASVILDNGNIGGNDTLTITHYLEWLRGRMYDAGVTVLDTGATAEAGQSGITIGLSTNRTLINRGIFDFNQGNFNNNSGTVLVNERIINWNNDRPINNGQFNIFPGAVLNITGNGITNFSTTLNNDGIVHVQNGVLNVNRGGSDSGNYNLNAGTRIQFGNGQRTLNSNSSINAPGAAVEFSSNTTVIEGVYTVDVTDVFGGTAEFNTDVTLPIVHLDNGELGGSGNHLITDSLQWMRGEISGSGQTTFDSAAIVIINGTTSVSISDMRQIINYTTIDWNTMNFINNSSAELINNGTLNIQNNNNTYNGGALVNNPGAVIQVFGSALTTIQASPFTNNGLLHITDGTVDIDYGGTGNGFFRTENNGTIEVSNLGYNFTTASRLEGNGTFAFTAFSGNINNEGVTAPGLSAGELTITTDFPMDSAATLQIEIGGYAPVNEYDRLIVNGTANLDGNLAVNFINGFSPQVGDTFRVLYSNDVVGQFNTVNAGGLTVQPTYDTQGVYLTVTDLVNQTPIALEDSLITDENIPGIVNVLNNDSDPDGDPLTLQLLTPPAVGSVLQSSDSSFQYTPNTNFFGQDSFLYRISDPDGASDDAWVFVEVQEINSPPTPFTLISPTDARIITGFCSPILFSWSPSSDPEGLPLTYQIHISGTSLDTTFNALDSSFQNIDGSAFFEPLGNYQWYVLASDGVMFTSSDTFSFTTQVTGLAGQYTIGTGGDYTTFNDAVNALQNPGISCDVTFNVLPGTYNERFEISSVTGADSTRMVTFQPLSGDTGDVLIVYEQTGNENGIVVLDSVSNITIRRLKFQAIGSTYRNTIMRILGGSNIYIVENIFIGNTNTVTSIISTNSSVYAFGAQNVTVTGNLFYDGGYGVFIGGNDIGVGLPATINSIVTENTFFNTLFTSINIYRLDSPLIKNNIIRTQHGHGISATECSNRLQILNNRVFCRMSDDFWIALYLIRNEGDSTQALIANNFLTTVSMDSANGGLVLAMLDNEDINIYHNSMLNMGNTSNGIHFEGNIDINFQNNNVINVSGGTTFSLSHTTNQLSNSDYNNFYTTGNVLANWGGQYLADLEALRNASGMDAHSVSVAPSFVSETDLHSYSFLLDSMGTFISDVTEDIDGEPRNATHPDIGADEFMPAIDGLGGEYTIGNTGDYSSLSEALQYLQIRGVADSVIFKIQPGTYQENLILLPVIGASSTNRIIFQSATGLPEDVILERKNSTHVDHLILISSADYTTIRNLTFDNGSNRFLRAPIIISKDTKAIHLIGNQFMLPLDSFSPAIGSTNVLTDSLIIQGNYFDGGYISLRGRFERYSQGININNNQLKGSLGHGIIAIHQDNPIISKNRININPDNYISQFGIAVNGCTNSAQITENRVSVSAENEGIGISLSNIAAGTSAGMVANNFVHVVVNNLDANITPQSAGIVINNSELDVSYNSVHLTGNLAPVRTERAALRITGNDIRVRNNILSNTMGEYAYFVSDTAAVALSDYNLFNTTGPILAHWIGDHNNLASLQLASGKDNNSIESDPLFVSGTNLHIRGNSPAVNAGIFIPEVTTDIDGQLRNRNTPDIGADESTSLISAVFRRNRLIVPVPPQIRTHSFITVLPLSNIEVSDYYLEDVNVLVDSLQHDDLRDIELYLTHNGITDTLVFDMPVNGANFIGTIFDDSASTAIQNGTAPFTGRFRPKSPLSRFNGMDPEGEWVLEIYNRSNNISGELNAWGIELTYGILTGINDDEKPDNHPTSFTLQQNYPNPFNPTTSIKFALPKAAQVQLDVFNTLGQKVTTIVNEHFNAGVHTVDFDAANLASGMYFYRIQAGKFTDIKKMILLQ